ncbi:MAG: hypothetical protein L7H21_05060 [Sulfolobales archaeon]|nr:hypothetical protein [Sulfolobales archaeon]MCG2894341.1 hypothetical protein [Sulfolobales archaeon]MCG2910980.1 hypothetical protein [Sulfolobales archaeon]
MRQITFVAVSLVLSLFDYFAGIELLRRAYGEGIASVFSSFPINLIYFTLIFLIELTFITSLSKVVGRLARRVSPRWG